MEHFVDYMAAATAVIAIIVSLINASGAARATAFKELEGIVQQLRQQLKEEIDRRKAIETELRNQVRTLEQDVQNERDLREAVEEKLAKAEAKLEKTQDRANRFERWARALSKQLVENHIKPVSYEDIG